MAHRTIDKNKGSLARGRSTALPEDQTAGVATDPSAEQPQTEDADPPAEPETESVAVGRADATADATDEEDLRISGGALARREPRAISRGPGAPAWVLANPVTRYLWEVYQELRKVTWPAWGDAWNMALVVIGMSVSVAIVLGAADFGLSHLVTWVFSHAASPNTAPTPTPTP